MIGDFDELTNSYKLVPKDDPTDRLEVEIGDSKQPDFKPQVKIMRWDNEVNASFRLLDDEPKQLTTEGEKIKLIGAKKEVHLYDIAPCEEHPEGDYLWSKLVMVFVSIIFSPLNLDNFALYILIN